jgi:hypothetical protein
MLALNLPSFTMTCKCLETSTLAESPSLSLQSRSGKPPCFHGVPIDAG